MDKVYIDELGNAIGHKGGTSNRLNILIDAHLDTVFPFGTVKEVSTKNGIVYAPVICNDTRGLAVNSGVIRALNYSGLKTKGNIMVVGTVEEKVAQLFIITPVPLKS